MQNLVPKIIQAPSAEDKNAILSDGIYEYFANTYGVRESKAKKTLHKKHEKHDRALKAVTELRNKARRDLRQAKREGRMKSRPLQEISLIWYASRAF